MSFLSNIFGCKKKEDADYNTLKIRAVSDLDDFEKAKLKKEFDSLYERINHIANVEEAEQRAMHRERNDVCPNCKCTDVTHRIEISTESSGHGMYSSTKNVNTKINVCGKCYEEWYHDEFRSYTTSQYDLADAIIRYLKYYHKAKHNEELDPNSLKEVSTDDAVRKAVAGCWANEIKKYMDGCSVELAKYLVEVVYGKFSQYAHCIDDWNKYDKAPLLEIGFKENNI